MADRFIISTDSTSDFFKSFMDKNGIHCIPIKRILGDKVYSEIYDSEVEYDAFYNEIKAGARPTTSQLTPDDFTEYFNGILEKEKKGDIIHVSISSAMSGTYNSSLIAANEINKTMKGRRVYTFDSLSTCPGMQMIVEKLMELNGNAPAEKAIESITDMRDNQHVFFILDDLYHAKRGGRVTAAQAFLGTLLGLKPILYFCKNGKNAIAHKIRGAQKALEYLAERTVKLAKRIGEDYCGKVIYLIRSTKSELFTKFKNMMQAKYPKAIFKETLVGPVLATHTGCGAVAICFEGQPRLDF